MCFTVHRRYPNPRTAKKDIVCYKAVYATFDDNGEDLEYYSIHQGFLYKPETEYSLGKGLMVQKQLYSFDGLRISAEIYQGFHSFSNKKRLQRWNTDYAHLKCIIPAGSQYYYNPDYQEYVSDRIKIVEEIDED